MRSYLRNVSHQLEVRVPTQQEAFSTEKFVVDLNTKRFYTVDEKNTGLDSKRLTVDSLSQEKGSFLKSPGLRSSVLQ